ncbi:S-methyl-5-thioribose-1-phosphate isomerase [Thermincola potens]|uniref:Methylthioribose-1-phosphate isomerase n=1 Tax=Thermincola potens (strain JR) TaxID=635013 RepID=D5X8M8_THEPJ|nr:S-methyl-5-thioribose-1-phosphate isomerase [Thermincola potens]ADG82904.1 translation initiation factor, aIF-2BI family [Thermincola potens JR]
METMCWYEDRLELLDQTKLPHEVVYVKCFTAEDVARAIKTMQVRGAPAIGASAAFGMALAALKEDDADRQKFLARMEEVGRHLAATRPTAVNLFWAIERMLAKTRELVQSGADLKEGIVQEALAIYREDIEMNKRIGHYGNEVVPAKANILTHCNAGALATAGYGTALGVIRAAHAAGKDIHVYADETRPLLQGARLTAWELMQDNIPVTLITDNMAGYLMRKGMIDLVVVGADRIAANGDVANKIGTYTVAVLAKANRVPFYVAAPGSTVDLTLVNGDLIPIEERGHEEVISLYGQGVAPQGVKVFNPAFDVTPHELITGIITDKGIIRPPFVEGLKKLFTSEEE